MWECRFSLARILPYKDSVDSKMKNINQKLSSTLRLNCLRIIRHWHYHLKYTKYTKYKKSLSMIMLICIKQHLKDNSWKSSAILRLNWKKAFLIKKRVTQKHASSQRFLTMTDEKDVISSSKLHYGFLKSAKLAPFYVLFFYLELWR